MPARFVVQWEDKVSAMFDALTESDIRYLDLQLIVEMIFGSGLYSENSTEFEDEKGNKAWLHRLPRVSDEMPQIYIFFRVFPETGMIRVYDFRFDEGALN